MASPFFPGQPGMTATSLRAVRYAMLVLLLGFGAFAYYQSQHVVPDPENPTDMSAIKWVGYGLCALVIVAIAVIRRIRESAAESTRPTLGLIGSAFAEGAALLGAVYMFLGGDISVYAIALVLFLSTWTLLPADSAA
ncbi:MAG: hypothetical protein ACJ8GN_18455 [Longimicrobiaceae bacterium]